MHQCEEHESDLSVDGVHYRLESLAEIKHFSRLRESCGVKFKDRLSTWLRLDSQHKEALRLRKLERVFCPPPRNGIFQKLHNSI
jgi:hypothetical protein